MSKCNTVDGYWWISFPQPRNWRNHFPRCPTETDKMASFDLEFLDALVSITSLSKSLDSSSGMEVSNSILISKKVLRVDKKQGSLFRKKKLFLMGWWCWYVEVWKEGFREKKSWLEKRGNLWSVVPLEVWRKWFGKGGLKRGLISDQWCCWRYEGTGFGTGGLKRVVVTLTRGATGTLKGMV